MIMKVTRFSKIKTILYLYKLSFLLEDSAFNLFKDFVPVQV